MRRFQQLDFAANEPIEHGVVHFLHTQRGIGHQREIGVSSSERSIAGAEWVSAPTEMKSTPVAAMRRTVFKFTPPLASNFTFRFRPRAIASRISVVSMLSSKMRSISSI